MLRALRSAFGSSVRAWCSGVLVIAVLGGATAIAEAVFSAGEEYQYLGTVVVMALATYAWTIAGGVVAITTPLRRRWRAVEQVITGAAIATLVIGAAIWCWLIVAIVPMGEIT